MADWLDDVVVPRESGGNPNIGWRNTDLTPWLRAGKTIYGFPDWPGLPGPAGNSTAAGLYQITKTNWKNLAPKLGVTDFSPQSQRKVADALMATQGRSAWAASEPGYKSGLRSPGGRPEGFYDNSLNLTLRPEQQEFPMAAALDALLGGKPTGDAQPGEDHPLLMLDSLLGPGPKEGADGERRAPDDHFIEPPARQLPPLNLFEQEPLRQTEVKPIAGVLEQAPQVRPAVDSGPSPLLRSLLDETQPIEPPGRGAAPMQPTQPAQAAAHPASMLDNLLGGAASSMRAGTNILPEVGRGVRRGAEAGFTGQPIEREGQPQITSPAEMAGAVPGAIAGGLLSPIHTGAEALRAATSGEPVAAGEMLAVGMAGMRPPVSRLPGGVQGQMPAIHGAVRGVLGSEQGAISLPPAIQKGIHDAAKGVEKVFSPSSVDDFSKAGEMLIRREVGSARRHSEQAEAQVGARGPLTNPPAADMIEAAREPWRPLVQRYVPELEAYVRSKQPGYAGPSLPDPALLRFLDFVETRGSGSAYTGPPELRPLADVLRKIYKERELAIAAEPSTAGTHFVEDYYAHQYTDPAGVARSVGSGARGQGSGRSLRQRTIPTLREAIDLGFKPVTLDPIDMTMRYVTNMDRYIAHNRIFRIGRDSGMIRFYHGGKAPDGWKPLTGRLAERAVATGGVPGALGMTAYAPEGFARIYNNSVALGFLHGELGGKAYQAVLHAKNAITQSVLGLSGFHAIAMSQEAAASALASGIEGLKTGDIAWGLKQIGLGTIPGVKAGKDVFGLGRKFERQYRGIQDYGPEFERVADLYAKAGGRAVGRGAEYQGTAADNYFKSFRRGHLALDLKTGFSHVKDGNPLYAPGRAVGMLGRELARINETVTSPLFDTLVPRLKGAAFFDEMSRWLRQNPMATMEEQLHRARQLQETMDDRFGELVMDNLFWGKQSKQFLQLAATSLGWEHGSIRSIGGGMLMDPVTGVAGKISGKPGAEIMSPRVRYVIGLAGAIALTNATYQYLTTGKTPGEGMGGLLSAGGALDLALPRTGGKTPEGAAERSLLPGFEKDVLGYMHDPIGELAGKLTPVGRLLVDAYTGRDYFGREIAPFPKYTPEWAKAYFNHVIKAATPIPMKQEQLKGTAIGTAERYLGNRPAAERWQNPMRQEKMETDSHIRALKGQLAGLYSHGNRVQQDSKDVAQKAKEILAQIQKLQGDYNRKLRESKKSEYLYKPPPLPVTITPKDARHSVGGP